MEKTNAYKISFKHEILNEFIASVDGFVTRNYLYSDKKMPDDIRASENELWDIYHRLPFENNFDALNSVEKRLLEIRDFIREHTPLRQAMNNEIDDCSEYSESDFKRAFERCYKMLTQNKTPVKKPQAFLLGGQSGAGKTTIHDIIQNENPNTIVLDGDRFREQHPNFEIICNLYGNNAANHTQKFSNSIVNALIERLGSEHYNLIIEGTCRTSAVPLNTCRYLKKTGYSVNLAVMCTDKQASWQSTINRFNEMKRLGLLARAVPREKFDETVKAIPDNISLLYQSGEFNNILLFNRNKECLYELKKHPQQNPAEIVKRELDDNPACSNPPPKP